VKKQFISDQSSFAENSAHSSALLNIHDFQELDFVKVGIL